MQMCVAGTDAGVGSTASGVGFFIARADESPRTLRKAAVPFCTPELLTPDPAFQPSHCGLWAVPSKWLVVLYNSN
jgi:hypothetical protein